MHSLRVAVEHAAETIHPMHAFVCESPAVERELLLGGKTAGGTRTLVFYVEGDADAYEQALATRPSVAEYDLRRHDDGFFCYVRAANADAEQGLLDAFRRETVVVVPPVEFRSDRTMRLRLVGHPRDLQGVLDDLPDGMTADVLEVGSTLDPGGAALTERQREAVAAAWAAGYYEVPRDGDIEAVAAELDCAVSTASGLLRRAEGRLVADALGVRR